jgi:ADP-ribosylglycohydrolase
MLPPIPLLRAELGRVIAAKAEQGHAVDGLAEELAALPAGYDRLAAFARRLADLPLRDGWPYREPNDLEAIRAESDPSRPLDAIAEVNPADAARRIETALLGRVCGCVLGKPLEVGATFDEIRRALEMSGAWPLHDYVSQRTLDALGRRHPSWETAVRERIAYVPPDDGLNYTVIGMMLLERCGTRFTRGDLRDLWLANLPVGWTFGPERAMLLRAGVRALTPDGPAEDEDWAALCNPEEECCGALIRADAYGYACPGRPALAAELAWRDASWTHRRTGIYGAMFAAAAVACAPVIEDPLGIAETALKYVPQRSRFRRIVADCLAEVAAAADWVEAYRRIHAKYGRYGPCRVYQECGTLINTLRFARSVGSGISKQVAQGNNTGGFGATAGSILGAYFGPEGLAPRWVEPFRDEIRTTVAEFAERSLSALAERMGRLAARVAAESIAGKEIAAGEERPQE